MREKRRRRGTHPGKPARDGSRAPDTHLAGTHLASALLADAVDAYDGLKAADPRARRRAATDPRGLLAIVHLLGSVPCLRVAPSAAPSGEAIRRHLLTRRPWLPPTYRVAQGVLLLPATPEEYRRGRSRQAMRTNVHHAESLGLSCSRLESGGDRERLRPSPFFLPPGRLEMLEERPDRDCWIVTDADGAPVGIGVVSVDTDVAMLWYLVTTNHPARWLLNLCITECLIAEGVSLLLVDDGHVLQMKPSTRYLQMLLGYRIAHLALDGVPAGRRRSAAALRVIGRALAAALASREEHAAARGRPATASRIGSG